MEDWKEFCFEGASTPPRQDAPENPTNIGFTISPPHRAYELDLQIYLDLLPFKEMIMDNSLEVHPEFDRHGRLHYHCCLYEARCPKDKYSIHARFLMVKHGFQNIPVTCKKIIGYTKDGKPKLKAVCRKATFNYRCSYYTDFPVTEKYEEYMIKDTELTEKILGYSKIDGERFARLCASSKLKYNIIYCGLN